MKTINRSDKELTESNVNSRIDHRSFVEHISKLGNVKSKKIVRKADAPNQTLFALLGLQDHTTRNKVSIHPEFVAYAFHLYGLSRKMFLYIVFYELDNNTCRFVIDSEMMDRFVGFCALFGEEETSQTILQAVRSLVRKNTMIATDGNEYMLNPLIAGGGSESKRRKLIDIYCRLLESKGLDTSIHFYPRYQVTL